MYINDYKMPNKKAGVCKVFNKWQSFFVVVIIMIMHVLNFNISFLNIDKKGGTLC